MRQIITLVALTAKASNNDYLVRGILVHETFGICGRMSVISIDRELTRHT
jgi:hypothetical protein